MRLTRGDDAGDDAIFGDVRSEPARRQAASAAFGEHLAHRFADQALLARR